MSFDVLWAGWRRDYVATAGEPSGAGGSVFTQILASGRPDTESHVLWRGATCFAILNAFPYVSGHLLVMPYREVADLPDLTPEEHTELWAAVRDAVVAVERAYHPDGINLGMNLGRAAGAGVPSHLHVHVMPRWNGDTSFITTVGGVRVMPETLDHTDRLLRDAWPRGTAQP